MISDSVRQVDEGTQLVHAAGGTMGEIVQSVQQVATIIGEISTAAREQTTGLSQVSEAVSQLDQMTQQNAALVEQSAAAAQSLREQATRLAGAVQVFKLSRGDGAAIQGGPGYVPRTALAGPMAQTGDGEGQHAPGSGTRAVQADFACGKKGVSLASADSARRR